MWSEAAATTPETLDIPAAAERIRGAIHRTPLEPSPWLTRVAGVPVYLKLECMQRTRSFKLRGALNAVALLSGAQRARGVVAASAGNHGQALALAASMNGVSARIFAPSGAPEVKKSRIRAFGAVLDDTSVDYDTAESNAAAWASSTGQQLVHAFSDAAVVAGQGTVGLEIVEDLPDVAHVIVPVGGGGLAAGIALALQERAPHAATIGVQSTETRAMYDAFAAGRVVASPITPTLADGLAGCTDTAAFERLRALIHRVVLVDETAIGPAIRDAFHCAGIVAEGAGAVGIAAVLEGSLQLDGPTAVVVTGGNIDGSVLARLLAP